VFDVVLLINRHCNRMG